MVSGIFAARSGTPTNVLNSVVERTSPPGEEVRGTATGGTPPIYTKTGDDGTTGRLFGGRVSKADPVIEACGTLDEAVAALGLGRAILEDERLQQIVLELQRGLFAVAAEIAANPRARERLVPGISSVTAEMTASLEQTIDALLAEHPLRPAFVVPGATPASAALDLARTFLRRAERGLIAGRDGGMTVSGTLIAYVNRASDLAYVLARRAASDGEEPLSHE
jgi:cob(I)alamin adenosyltransferase